MKDRFSSKVLKNIQHHIWRVILPGKRFQGCVMGLQLLSSGICWSGYC